MASDLISFSEFTVNHSKGVITCQRVTSVDVSEDSKTTAVTAYGVKGGAGFRDEEGGGGMNLDVMRERVPEVDWRGLKARKEVFSVTLQDEGGERWQYQNCRVSHVNRKGDDKGSHMDTVAIVWLKCKQLPTPPVGF